jgi:two-component system, chemotaxis family, chemotaxis protein CheY
MINSEGVKKLTILIVNDAPAVSTFIKLILKSEGYDSRIAVNGVEAVKMLEETHYDLIITDLNMPEMDGYELTRRTRQHEKYRFIPIIFLTGGDKSEIFSKAKESGSTAFITTPFEKEKLTKIIRTLIR